MLLPQYQWSNLAGYNGPNGHLFYVGGDLMMRRGMLPIIMLPDGDLRIVLHLVPFWILTIWRSVHIEETVVGIWVNEWHESIWKILYKIISKAQWNRVHILGDIFCSTTPYIMHHYPLLPQCLMHLCIPLIYGHMRIHVCLIGIASSDNFIMHLLYVS